MTHMSAGSRRHRARPVRMPAACVVAALLLAIACDRPSPSTAPVRPSSGGPATPQARPPDEPPLRVENLALGASHARVRAAIADIRAAGLWDELTRHLYVVQIESRPGRVNMPDDGHLADAFLTATIDQGGSGGLCSIMFFPSAIRADLQRVNEYFEQGLAAEEPPSRRAFWASILGHELGHCFPGQPGEDVAQRWESRVLGAVEDQRS
jgi:hypothetical protein